MDGLYMLSHSHVFAVIERTGLLSRRAKTKSNY